jgi:hypothetical protein
MDVGMRMGMEVGLDLYLQDDTHSLIQYDTVRRIDS